MIENKNTRYAILGDIHANAEALDAVLEDAALEGCTDYACVGDIVGIGASPRECVEKIKRLCVATVQGDFDETESLDAPLDDLNPVAKRMYLWTREQLGLEQKRWLAGLDLVQELDGFMLVHASLELPESWYFVTNEFDAAASISLQRTKLCFFGHTHSPKFYMKTEGAEWVSVQSGERILIEAGAKYFINVGSVGNPRDGDPRACYAIYDREQGVVRIKRVDYDSGEAARKVSDLGLTPSSGQSRLAESDAS